MRFYSNPFKKSIKAIFENRTDPAPIFGIAVMVPSTAKGSVGKSVISFSLDP
jgi:hypothetical protein